MNGNFVAVYDNSANPSAINDWYITQKQYQASNPGGMTGEFDSLRKQGYNVGLSAKPKTNSGKVSNIKSSVGFLIRPQINVHVTKNLTINLGGYFLYQLLTNTTNNNYRLTDKVGDYNSLLNGVTNSVNQSYGFTAGVQICPGKRNRDKDGDGIPDKNDDCPKEFGLRLFNGCPDSDGDGIRDKDDSCPHQKGLPKLFGCPDSDGDGIADRYDKCGSTPICVKVDAKGCPLDFDNDGVPDYKDTCLYIKGVAENGGCPIYFSDSTVQFSKGKSTILTLSHALLDSCVKMLKQNPGVDLSIEGYDKTNKSSANKKLSGARAEEVKKYIVKKGVESSRLVIHSSENIGNKGGSKKQRALIGLKYKIN